MSADPFLRWAGGKRLQTDTICSKLPRYIRGVYYEPFVGGGAMFFELFRRRALQGDVVLTDTNPELVNAWVQIRDNVAQVCAEARRWDSVKSVYYHVRDMPHENTPLGAARMLWLNRHCFNGLFRMGRKRGIKSNPLEFNVPWGFGKAERAPKQRTLDEGNLHSVSRALQRVDATILVADFLRSIDVAGDGDVVYADPPYIKVKADSFTTYDGTPFEMEQHLVLIDALERAGRRGADWVLSNSGGDESFDLYDGRDGLEIHEVMAPRNINSKGRERGVVPELLIYPEGQPERVAA